LITFPLFFSKKSFLFDVSHIFASSAKKNISNFFFSFLLKTRQRFPQEQKLSGVSILDRFLGFEKKIEFLKEIDL